MYHGKQRSSARLLDGVYGRAEGYARVSRDSRKSEARGGRCAGGGGGWRVSSSRVLRLCCRLRGDLLESRGVVRIQPKSYPPMFCRDLPGPGVLSNKMFVCGCSIIRLSGASSVDSGRL
uniref:Nucleic acid binding protein n=1 Tax=Rhizophora mucronata TaxID=61149 RepID=A0A2P2N556_RHIMU